MKERIESSPSTQTEKGISRRGFLSRAINAAKTAVGASVLLTMTSTACGKGAGCEAPKKGKVSAELAESCISSPVACLPSECKPEDFSGSLGCNEGCIPVAVHCYGGKSNPEPQPINLCVDGKADFDDYYQANKADCCFPVHFHCE